MWLYVVLFIVLFVLMILVVAATKPATFQVQRATTIQASPDKIFPLINDFHQWGVWSPWEKLDPHLSRTFSGAESGRGAHYAWKGNKKVGTGQMEILESTSPTKIVIKLDFLEPFEAHNTTIFTISPQGSGSAVNWDMHGNHNFMSKIMAVFMSMDKMVGKDFESGLANMKAAAEG